ncbi:MAG: Uridine kinase [Chrysothrix sp. TS-e1954]|nr:MAG: Uridine kinase [Chrysothrix sp. TS-e1954]
MHQVSYSPPWVNLSIVGVAGSSGSGKSTMAHALQAALNLPWDSFYKVLGAEESHRAFQNEYDFDSPNAIDFDALVEKLVQLREGKKVEIPIYSFESHARLDKTHTIYSPHVLILEGIFALHDSRVLDMLDLRVNETVLSPAEDADSH